jgi:predicted nucleic acid-binding protein
MNSKPKFAPPGLTNVRLVLGTNVVVSAVLCGGMPRQVLFAAAHGRIDLYT